MFMAGAKDAASPICAYKFTGQLLRLWSSASTDVGFSKSGGDGVDDSYRVDVRYFRGWNRCRHRAAGRQTSIIDLEGTWAYTPLLYPGTTCGDLCLFSPRNWFRRSPVPAEFCAWKGFCSRGAGCCG